MKIIWIISLFLISVSCSTTQCSDKNSTAAAKPPAEAAINTGVNQMLKVKVYKADGSLQCDQGQKISLDVMAKELTGIKIFSSENKHDGLMRIQLCGKPTGSNNVYEISQADFDRAISLGFKKWVR